MRRGLFPVLISFILILAASHAQARGFEWSAGDDVFAVAEDLTVDRSVSGALTAAGNIVILTRDARISGDTWVTARRTAIEGVLDGDVSIRAQEALINGRIKGNVTFYGLQLSLGPDAQIDGNVDYYSPSTAYVDRGARVAGDVNGNPFASGKGVRMESERPAPPQSATRDRWREDHMRQQMDNEGYGLSAPGYHMSAGGAVFFGVLALLFSFAAPVTTGRMSRGLANEAGLSFGLGLLWLIGVPVLIVLVAITILGLPLAFLLLLLWPLGMVFGLVALLVALGNVIADKLGEIGSGALGRVVGVILATALVWIGIAIPILGALVWLVAVSVGVGLLYVGFRAIEKTEF